MDEKINEKHMIGKVVYGECLPKNHRLLMNSDQEWFYVVNKNRPYESFGWEYFGREMKGESLNEEALNRALNRNCLIVFIHNFKIYTIESFKFQEYVIANNTRKITSSGEVILSIPLSIMKEYRRKHE